MNLMKIGGAALLAAVGITIGTSLLDAIDNDRARNMQAHKDQCLGEFHAGTFKGSNRNMADASGHGSSNTSCAGFAMNGRQITH